MEGGLVSGERELCALRLCQEGAQYLKELEPSRPPWYERLGRKNSQHLAGLTGCELGVGLLTPRLALPFRLGHAQHRLLTVSATPGPARLEHCSHSVNTG